ncbi:MAG TPA: hypothetical protein VIH74_04190 [Candidatus Acidoferrum sp.]
MSIRRVEIALFTFTALAAGLAVIGCSGKAASVRQEKARALAASAPRPTVAGLAKPAEHFIKATARDSSFAKYYDPDCGVTLRYPRNFVLLESAWDDPDRDADSERVISWEQAKQAGAGVRTAEELGADDAGAALLATIVVPDDAYPNTAFAGGSVQFAVNRYQTAGTCRSNLLGRMGDDKGARGTVTAQGVSFAWIDTEAGDGSTEFYERDYAGFANDACYEFFVRVGVKSTAPVEQMAPQNASGGSAGPDAASSVTSEESAGSRRLDERKILVHLEKIVASLQVESVSASVLDKPRYKPAPAFPASN